MGSDAIFEETVLELSWFVGLPADAGEDCGEKTHTSGDPKCQEVKYLVWDVKEA